MQAKPKKFLKPKGLRAASSEFWNKPRIGKWNLAALLTVVSLGLIILVGVIYIVAVAYGWADVPNTPRSTYPGIHF